MRLNTTLLDTDNGRAGSKEVVPWARTWGCAKEKGIEIEAVSIMSCNPWWYEFLRVCCGGRCLMACFEGAHTQCNSGC